MGIFTVIIFVLNLFYMAFFIMAIIKGGVTGYGAVALLSVIMLLAANSFLILY